MCCQSVDNVWEDFMKINKIDILFLVCAVTMFQFIDIDKNAIKSVLTGGGV